MTDDQLRAAYAAHLRAGADAPAGACASPEDLLALVRREGPEAHRLTVLDHVMGCERCRAEFELLRAIEAAGQEGGRAAPPRADDVRPLRQPVRARRWAGPIGLALAASIAVMVGVRQRRARDGAADGTADAAAGADVERDAAGAADGVALVAPAAGAAPAGAPLRFVWRAVPRATRYELEVLAPDGAVAAATATADTAWQLTDPRPLAPGVTYRWWVRAIGDAGAARRSPLRVLRVGPR